MAAILNSTILDSTILHKKKLHLFFLTQLDDGSHLEFCHLGFSHFAQNSDSNQFNLTQTHSFWLNLMMAAFFNLAILDSTIFVLPLILTQTCQEWFPPFAQKKLTHISLPTICTKNLHPFILTQLDDGSHLEFCHVEFSHLEQNSDSEFRHCHLGFRHLVIFSQIHSKTLSLYSDSESN